MYDIRQIAKAFTICLGFSSHCAALPLAAAPQQSTPDHSWCLKPLNLTLFLGGHVLYRRPPPTGQRCKRLNHSLACQVPPLCSGAGRDEHFTKAHLMVHGDTTNSKFQRLEPRTDIDHHFMMWIFQGRCMDDFVRSTYIAYVAGWDAYNLP